MTSGTNHFIFAHFFVRVETAATIEEGKRGKKITIKIMIRNRES